MERQWHSEKVDIQLEDNRGKVDCFFGFPDLSHQSFQYQTGPDCHIWRWAGIFLMRLPTPNVWLHWRTMLFYSILPGIWIKSSVYAHRYFAMGCKMISVIWQLQSGSDDRWLGGCIKIAEVAEMTVCLSIACNSAHDSGSSWARLKQWTTKYWIPIEGFVKKLYQSHSKDKQRTWSVISIGSSFGSNQFIHLQRL